MSNQPIWGFPNQQAITTNELGGLLQYKEVEISSAQMLTLASNPIVLADTTNPNQYFLIDKIIVEFKAGSSPYALVDIESRFGFDGSILKEAGLSPITLPGNWVWVFKDAPDVRYPSWPNYPIYYANPPYQYIKLYFNEDPTGGNGTMKVKMWYSIQQFG